MKLTKSKRIEYHLIRKRTSWAKCQTLSLTQETFKRLRHLELTKTDSFFFREKVKKYLLTSSITITSSPSPLILRTPTQQATLRKLGQMVSPSRPPTKISFKLTWVASPKKTRNKTITWTNIYKIRAPTVSRFYQLRKHRRCIKRLTLEIQYWRIKTTHSKCSLTLTRTLEGNMIITGGHGYSSTILTVFQWRIAVWSKRVIWHII
jgi:hypothetical protein